MANRVAIPKFLPLDQREEKRALVFQLGFKSTVIRKCEMPRQGLSLHQRFYLEKGLPIGGADWLFEEELK